MIDRDFQVQCFMLSATKPKHLHDSNEGLLTSRLGIFNFRSNFPPLHPHGEVMIV